MNRKELLTTSGFLLFLFGTLSIILSAVGLELSFLMFLNMWGSIIGFLIKITMIAAGLVLTYIGTRGYYK